MVCIGINLQVIKSISVNYLYFIKLVLFFFKKNKLNLEVGLNRLHD